MTDILVLAFIAMLIERCIKYRVKKTDANTSVGRRVRSVKQLWRWKEDKE
jgi:hypothetical protein